MTSIHSLLAIAGVHTVCIIDDSGRLVEIAGSSQPPPAAVLVLAHATMSAASELGRRTGSGDCLEIIQHHEGGHILLHGLPLGRALLVQCLPGSDINTVRQSANQITSDVASPPRHAHVSSLSDALHAMPAW